MLFVPFDKSNEFIQKIIRGVIKTMVDWRLSICVALSISLIFTLAIRTHNFNTHYRFHCEILRTKIKFDFLQNQRYRNPAQPANYSLTFITSLTFRKMYFSEHC